MEKKLDDLLKEIINSKEVISNLLVEINNYIECNDDNISKKVYKGLKKLDYYLDGGKSLLKDAIEVIENRLEKDKSN